MKFSTQGRCKVLVAEYNQSKVDTFWGIKRYSSDCVIAGSGTEIQYESDVSDQQSRREGQMTAPTYFCYIVLFLFSDRKATFN